eukprot:TRINITY_DN3020_c0_g1_i1.p1 TRINITY_DN3020_c0_g1~~TRINITY_DN3020_c0_g1_i1.p1  ORF type:complete len:251 (+),score=69.17 TRINITY_DN3020_c0_g1_i1:57-755(+)
MLISFANLLEDIQLLKTLNANYVKEFCGFALDHIRKGAPNRSVYKRAAEQLKVEAEALEKLIAALTEIFVESAKKDLSANDLMLSLTELKLLTEDTMKLIVEHYQAKEIRRYLSELSMKLKHYTDLDWRLDVQLASRCLRQQVTPSFLLQLHTSNADAASISASSSSSSGSASSSSSLLSTSSSSSTSSASSTTQIDYLQTDFANLKHMVSELERAVSLNKTSYARRVLKIS